MSDKETNEWSETMASAFDVVDGEFVVVTADGADQQFLSPLCALLRRVRNAFGMEAAFISEWAGGEPMVHRVDFSEDAGIECDSLQSLFGTRLLGAGASEAGNASFDAVAVVTSDGVVHGTLCSRGESGGDEQQRAALRSVARLIAKWFDEAELSLSGLMTLQGNSTMGLLAAA
jgi:hypothetical protein